MWAQVAAIAWPMLQQLLGKVLTPDQSGQVPLLGMVQAAFQRLEDLAKRHEAEASRDPFSTMLEQFEAIVPAGKEGDAIKAIQQGLEARAAWRKVVGTTSGTTNFSRERG